MPIAAGTPDESADHLEKEFIPGKVISFAAMLTVPPINCQLVPEFVDLNNFNNEVVLRVLSETDEEYLISSCYDLENATQNNIFNQKIRLNKAELNEKGFKYI